MHLFLCFQLQCKTGFSTEPSVLGERLLVPQPYGRTYIAFRGGGKSSWYELGVCFRDNTCSDPLFYVTIFSWVWISQFWKTVGFAQKKTHEIQNQIKVLDFSVYFGLKFLSFAKVNPREISRFLHSRSLVQATILCRKCMIFTSKKYLQSLTFFPLTKFIFRP